jgi:hypothetical protein
MGLYLANAVLLINHEIDSAFWREWELFKLPGGINFFIALHLPLVALVLWGLVLMARQSSGGLYFSLGLALCGLFAFGIHLFFISKGHPQFKTPASLGLLLATLIASLLQLVLVVRFLTS